MRTPLPISILVILRAGGDHLTPAEQIRMDLRLSVQPVPGSVEVSEALDQLADKGLAVSLRDSITGQVKWQITDDGRAQLASRRL